jgi:hypothetical protein
MNESPQAGCAPATGSAIRFVLNHISWLLLSFGFGWNISEAFKTEASPNKVAFGLAIISAALLVRWIPLPNDQALRPAHTT